MLDNILERQACCLIRYREPCIGSRYVNVILRKPIDYHHDRAKNPSILEVANKIHMHALPGSTLDR